MPTVKLDSESHQFLQELSTKLDTNMGALLKEAISRMQREWFWKGVREDFERLRRNKKEWEAYLAEAETWEALPDGLNDETEEWAKLYPEFGQEKRVKRSRK
jgi:predicted transcriptional regulator